MWKGQFSEKVNVGTQLSFALVRLEWKVGGSVFCGFFFNYAF